MNFKALARLLILPLALPLVAADAAFPNKTIVLVAWSAAGSPVDVLAREVARLAPKYLHQSMIVEDKTGGDGANAMQFILSSPSDGYALLINTRSMMATLNTDLRGKFTTEQFDFLATLETDPYAIAVRTESPFKTIRDLLASAKTTPISIGGFGADSAHAMLSRHLAAESGAKLNWVPFNGGSAALVAVLGGHMDAMLGNISDQRAQVADGKLRILAVSTDKPLADYPNALPFRALGYPDLTSSHWRGVMAKAGTPADVTAKLDAFFKAVSKDAEFVAFVKNSGLLPYYNDRAAFAKLVKSDMEAMAKQTAASVQK
ncbi:MAG: tripartite tricarboxylate transporter substrate binding protein [Candidatus Eremiobacteraeota bacterium]|nr:tripartite tricarboxylate transporter substrate binding protein [Candidatus Eremiobacteraeota bacterium]